MENWDPSIDPTFRKGQCCFYTWPFAPDPEFQEETLHEQDYEAKNHLFRNYLPTHNARIERGAHVLERLRQIDPAAAALFAPKPYLVEGMTLRLINGETTDSPKSYSALSYCWQQGAAPPDPGRRHVPINSLLYQHFILQRETADEGVWCDQLCIDQTDKAEKAATISAMDALYTCARVVVVALEDVEVSPEEQAFLRAFIADYEDERHPPMPPPHLLESLPFMSVHPVLLGFFVKVCGSRWFRRAWCSHEMRLGRRHRFLARCAGQPANTLLSFSDFFLSYLCMLSSSVAVPADVKPVRDTVHRVFSYAAYIDELRRVLNGAPEKTVDEALTPAYTTHVSEIFALGAGGDPNAEDRERDANLDRITIVLNTVGNGLCLRREEAARSPLTASTENCQRLLLTLSLAAGDPTALCTNGDPFTFIGSQASWLRRPHHTDIGSGATRQEPLPRMDDSAVELDPSPALAWIAVDMLLPGALEEPSADLWSLAALLVSEARNAGLGGGFLGQLAQGPEYLGWRMEADFEDWNVNFTGILASILQFGPRWTLGMAAKCGFAGPTVLDDVRAAVRAHFADGFDAGYLRGLEWTASAEGLRAVNALLRIAYWMVGWSMSIMPQTAPERASWKPWICPLAGANALVIAPEGVVPAVPVALLRAGSDRLPRAWLLSDDRPSLLGKSILFADLSDGEYNEVLGSCLQRHMKIYGPP
ncbi:hypothetical protein NKR23_g8924 [Pleurostoma richardsiae]|uniref:Heterokaryon incompatibility domain-containing protein n=1 Tax=Pleurostoma richardsiae TaxID=41990 RepID=A0AA38VNP6_9PEZI|nr:hypothetical protein NKR23_g8924 [Pleurostoma richardsiae]